jgi:hypothetical protein
MNNGCAEYKEWNTKSIDYKQSSALWFARFKLRAVERGVSSSPSWTDIGLRTLTADASHMQPAI